MKLHVAAMPLHSVPARSTHSVEALRRQRNDGAAHWGDILRLRHFVLAALAAVLAAGTATTTATATTTSADDPVTAVALTNNPATATDTAQQLGVPGGNEIFTIDPKTGKVMSVTKDSVFTPAISTTRSCPTGYACYTAPTPNYQQGFYGTPGRLYGSWPNRNGYNSGYFGVNACYTVDLEEICVVPVLAPGNRLAFSRLVTGTSFRIHY
jgi:hypothetical protein